MKKRVRTLLAVGISAGLYAYVASGTDLEAAVAPLGRASAPLVLICLALIVPIGCVHCLRWTVLARASGCATGYRSALAVHWLGLFYNALVPGQVGLDGARLLHSRRLGAERPQMLAVVMADRFLGAFALSLVASVAALLLAPRLPSWVVALAPGFLGLLVLVATVGWALLRRIPPEGSHEPVGLRERLGYWLRSLAAAAKSLLSRPAAAAAALGVTTLQIGLSCLAFGVLASALGVSGDSLYVALTLPLASLLVMLLPFTVNGIGVREGAFVLILLPLGVTQGEVISLAGVWLLLHVAVAALGIFSQGLLSETVSEDRMSTAS